MSKPYVPRVIDPYLEERLGAVGALYIRGAKYCGKTRTAENIASSALYMQDPDLKANNLKLADFRPSKLLEGDTPRLIDEWQVAPVLWDAVRFEVDRRDEKGQFILTGSSVPSEDKTSHSGTGRISGLIMRPMSLYELGVSNGAVSLRDLFDGMTDVDGHSETTVERLSAALVRGGWPGSIGMEDKAAARFVIDYVDSVRRTDVNETDGVNRNPDAMFNVMRSLARNTSTMATMTTIHADMAGDDNTLSTKSVSDYINALRRIFVVEDVPAWSPSLRSRTAVRTSPKRNFVDPSIAAAVLRISLEHILDDMNTFGLLFESLCVRDLRVYSQVMDGEVFHYHDRNGLEADIVVQLADGRWGAIEVKLGSRGIEDGAENLRKIRDIVDTDRMRDPSFLMVLTATEYAYTRPDGIHIVPIGCLKD